MIRECWEKVKSSLYEYFNVGDKKLYVTSLSSEKPVYRLYTRDKSVDVVVKFFWAEEYVKKEYDNLSYLVSIGFDIGTLRVPKPYFFVADGTCFFLVTEMVKGNDLDHYLGNALIKHRYEKLYSKLDLVVIWFIKLYKLTWSNIFFVPDVAFSYYEKLFESIARWGYLLPSCIEELKHYVLLWREKKIRSLPYSTIIHGDATPTNIIINGNTVYGIDLERMKRCDPMWDIGFMCAEIKHYFMWKGKTSFDAEPFVSHFFKSFAKKWYFEDFDSLSSRLPFYMAMGYLRIARNPWLKDEYRLRLVEEALNCLRYGL